MEYFGWESLFGELFNNKLPKTSNLRLFPLDRTFICVAASFELRITKIGQVILKLFDSTLKLEIPIPTLK
jgi:hypothetical protein